MSLRSSGWLLGACLALPVLADATTCTVSVTGVAFGSYDVFSTQDSETTGSVGVSCDSSDTYTISLSSGFGTYTARVMTSGSSQLDYNLFTDPQRLTVWGDGTSGTATVSATGTGGTYPVYGLITAKQNVPVGNYSDTITVTVTY